jgi:hypothetical protein
VKVDPFESDIVIKATNFQGANSNHTHSKFQLFFPFSL